MTDFNKTEEELQDNQEPEVIKLGENEYSQDELQKLVDIGRVGLEAQEKYNTDITKVWPDYTRKSQELKEANEKLAELEKEPEAEIDQNDVVSEAKKQLESMGYVDKTQIETLVKQQLSEQRLAQKIMEDTESLLGEIKKEGKPDVSKEDLLQHMNDFGGFGGDPRRAYRDMKEKELDKWKMDNFEKAKNGGLVTETGSTAGSKQPVVEKTTPENLSDRVREALNSR